MYRTDPPETEVLRLQEELEATKKQLVSLKRRLWVLLNLILGAIPPALVLRYHAPRRILVLDVLGFALWGYWITRRRG